VSVAVGSTTSESPKSSMSNALTKTERSRTARKTVNETIPRVLQASARAKSGIEHVQLLKDKDLPQPSPSKERKRPYINVVTQDTLQAAYELVNQSKDKAGQVAVLSMTSELRPGGGFLSGASAQEESLCLRTTLYASLKEEFYRIPELGCIYSPDICVFSGLYNSNQHSKGKTELLPVCNAAGESNLYSIGQVNPKTAWWFINVISCAAVRNPDVDDQGCYYDILQKDLMREKIKRILRAAALHGCRKIVLGAFGCGAFGNPPREVAALFRRCIVGREGNTGQSGEFAGYFDEIIFAIKGGPQENLTCFKEIFSDFIQEGSESS